MILNRQQRAEFAEGEFLRVNDMPDPSKTGAGSEISIKDMAVLTGDLAGFKGKTVWDTTEPRMLRHLRGGRPRHAFDILPREGIS